MLVMLELVRPVLDSVVDVSFYSTIYYYGLMMLVGLRGDALSRYNVVQFIVMYGIIILGGYARIILNLIFLNRLHILISSML